MDYKPAISGIRSTSRLAYQPDPGEGNLRIIVAAGEEDSRSELRRILQAEDGVQVIAESADTLDAVAKIRRLRPDLVFLDLQMKGPHNLDSLGNLDYLPEMVFTSSLHE